MAVIFSEYKFNKDSWETGLKFLLNWLCFFIFLVVKQCCLNNCVKYVFNFILILI